MNFKITVKNSITKDGFKIPYHYPLNYTLTEFSAGELHPQLKLFKGNKILFCEITGFIETPSHEKELNLLLSALKAANKDMKICVYLPYLPYSRQDRVCAEGDADSCQIFIDTLKLCGATRVVTDDIHSIKFLHKNLGFLETKTPFTCFSNFMKLGQSADFDNFIDSVIYERIQLVAPDKSAVPRVKNILNRILMKRNINPPTSPLYNNIVYFDKVREQETGKITSYCLSSGKLTGKSILLIDDICDGGFTFKLASEEIQRQGYNVWDIELFTTHGIYSKGLSSLNNHFNAVHCLNDLRTKKPLIGKNSFLL